MTERPRSVSITCFQPSETESLLEPHSAIVFRSQSIDDTRIPLTPVPDQMLVPLVDREVEMEAVIKCNPLLFEQIRHSCPYDELKRLWKRGRSEIPDAEWLTETKRLIAVDSLFVEWSRAVGSEYMNDKWDN